MTEEKIFEDINKKRKRNNTAIIFRGKKEEDRERNIASSIFSVIISNVVLFVFLFFLFILFFLFLSGDWYKETRR
jgi:hypothetical protein